MVLYDLDADFVMVADGDTRKLGHLKKKRRKHLAALPVECPEILELFRKGQLKDSDIRRALYPIANGTEGAQAPTENREG